MNDSKAVQKWADKAMFKAEEIDASAGPQVKLLSCNNDPLGTIAAAALMYEGKSVASLAEITDEQRRYYLEQVQKSVLEAPLEFVNFHFIISGVTRGFTHQMVRQRTATYTQESTRFAVKETVPVAPPPSLDGTISWPEWMWKCSQELFPGAMVTKDALTVEQAKMVQDYAFRQASKQQLWRREWDTLVEDIDSTYNALVSAGMPAEDARGLLPTNLLTRINYNTSLRGLKDHAGVRLCLQAQYEWRLVWKQILEAIREYPVQNGLTYSATLTQGDVDQMTPGHEVGDVYRTLSSQWQFDALADIFKPICYATGKCEFMANVDRFCGIRDRVEAHHKAGTPSDKWVDIDLQKDMWTNESGARVSQ
jgi:thymidylate synthase ThyX